MDSIDAIDVDEGGDDMTMVSTNPAIPTPPSPPLTKEDLQSSVLDSNTRGSDDAISVYLAFF